MKKVILLLIIFTLCGCHAKVDINIDNSDIFSENVEIKELRTNIETTNSYEKYIEEMISYNFGSSTLNNYTKTNIIDSDYIGLNLAKDYKYNLCYAFKSSGLKYAMYDLKCKEEKGVYEVTGTPTYFVCGSDCFMKPEISSATVNISLPNEAISSNADIENNNVYTWNFNGSEGETLKLKFKVEQEENISLDTDENTKSNKKDSILIILIILVILISIILLINILYKKYKENKLEY